MYHLTYIEFRFHAEMCENVYWDKAESISKGVLVRKWHPSRKNVAICQLSNQSGATKRNEEERAQGYWRPYTGVWRIDRTIQETQVAPSLRDRRETMVDVCVFLKLEIGLPSCRHLNLHSSNDIPCSWLLCWLGLRPDGILKPNMEKTKWMREVRCLRCGKQ